MAEMDKYDGVLREISETQKIMLQALQGITANLQALNSKANVIGEKSDITINSLNSYAQSTDQTMNQIQAALSKTADNLETISNQLYDLENGKMAGARDAIRPAQDVSRETGKPERGLPSDVIR